MECPLNIYITAHTLISSLGFDIPENLEAIHNYQSGIRIQEAGLISDHPLLAEIIDSMELEERAKLMQIMDYTRMERLSMLAIQEVVSQSGVDLQEPGYASLLSTTRGDVDLLSELPANSPAFLWKMTERIGDFFRATNQVEVISSAYMSGVSALIVAKRWIESGRYRRVIVAGGDILSHFITGGFLSFQSASAHLYRPYDIQWDELSLGKACGVILLETQGSANHIVLSGGITSNDANHISGPSRTGDDLAPVIDQAMGGAGALPEDISLVNIHGIVMVYSDEMESKAIHPTGLAAVPVNDLRPYFGHTLGALGIIETILCVGQLKEGRCYGILGYEALSVPMPIAIYTTHWSILMECCIKTASDFGGYNATLVLSLPGTHLKQRANSQATDKVGAPSVYKAVMGSGNMVTVRPGAIKNKRTTVFGSSETDFTPFVREAYKHLGENNVKLYKTDNPYKLGYAAAEYLLKGINYHPKEIGIILANVSSSLDTDCKYQAVISKERGRAAGLAVFVYTLLNVVLGEICIRHKIQGKNTFFIRRQSNTASLEDYVRTVMAKSRLCTCVISWCELLDGHYQAELRQPNNISAIYG